MNLRRRTQKVIEGVAPKLPPKKTKTGEYDLNHKYICISGAISGITRPQAKALLRKQFPNSIYQDTVTSITDILITGYGIGQRKIKEAAKWGVTIIDAKEIF